MGKGAKGERVVGHFHFFPFPLFPHSDRTGRPLIAPVRNWDSSENSCMSLIHNAAPCYVFTFPGTAGRAGHVVCFVRFRTPRLCFQQLGGIVFHQKCWSGMPKRAKRAGHFPFSPLPLFPSFPFALACQGKSRLCRLTCGKARPFRTPGSPLKHLGWAACRKARRFPHIKRRSRSSQ